MVIVKLMGGLGNQIFQYCIGRKLSYINNTSLFFDISHYSIIKDREYGLDHFGINVQLAKSFDMLKFGVSKDNYSIIRKLCKFGIKTNILPLENYTRLIEKSYTYSAEIFKQNGNVYLEGYWQSYKYFDDINSLIMKDFVLDYKKDLLTRRITSTNSVSLHVRRGDYIYNVETNKIHGACSLEYYFEAVNKIISIIPNPVFFIFSDDLNWIQHNFKLDAEVVYVNGYRDYDDLILMSLCKHHIIANSSFSWWGAWLSKNDKKIIIAPRKWFNIDINTNDLIPNNWIRI